MLTSFRHLDPDKIPTYAWAPFDDPEFRESAERDGPEPSEFSGSIADAMQVADSAASFFHGRFRSATGMWFASRGPLIELPWHGDYPNLACDGSPTSTSIAAEVEALAAEILPLVSNFCGALPCPQISLSHEQFYESPKRQMQAVAVEVLLMVDGFLTAISLGESSKAIEWLSAAYLNLLTCNELASQMTLPAKNVSLAECFNASKENVDDEDDESAVYARIQARGGSAD